MRLKCLPSKLFQQRVPLHCELRRLTLSHEFSGTRLQLAFQVSRLWPFLGAGSDFCKLVIDRRDSLEEITELLLELVFLEDMLAQSQIRFWQDHLRDLRFSSVGRSEILRLFGDTHEVGQSSLHRASDA